ncbi:tRNA 2-selenouridine(34) synthase MnmH [Trichloromonas sp.]|uniref:tRNA 2-selenouridine(34) synthase MnmH n=1 Tax=Trichloromonas sp. TaxID=3069249 RepID=UPI003D81B550
MSEDVTIELERALILRDQGALLVDARTPAEFAEATIPGAINVPIFSDEERAEVGTLYKQQGKQVARRLGVRLVSPKLPGLIEQVEAAWQQGRGPVVVFCWRGGMRSRALTAFLNLAGIPARQLQGGHKRFRSLVCDFFEQGQWGRLLVLRGMTGVGKTRLLKQLAGDGYPVIDLEGLAGHRGSAFGALGLPPQPTQKRFEAALWDELRKVPPGCYALAEGESRHIGRLLLPPRIYAALQTEKSLWINASLDYRIRVILEDYPALDELRAAFVAPITALKPRLGGEAVARMLALLGEGRWEELVRELMVLYYDPLYDHTRPARRIEIDIEPEPEGIARLKAAIAELLAAAAQ